MADIFSELEGMGISQDIDKEIFEKKDTHNDSKKPKTTLKSKQLTPEQILFTARLTCPICHKEAEYRAVKSGKARLVKTELDLKPIYTILDPSMYEVVCCNNCGYAALRKDFKNISPKKIDIIKKKVSPNYLGRNYPDIYSYENAIERYKLALYDAMITEAKDSDKAYLCLRIAWLYRGYYQEEENISPEKKNDLVSNEKIFMGHALEGFKQAHYKESFPIAGMDEPTLNYLIGELSRREGNYEEASRWISEVIVAKGTSRRLKDKAIEVKELIKNAKINIKDEQADIPEE